MPIVMRALPFVGFAMFFLCLGSPTVAATVWNPIVSPANSLIAPSPPTFVQRPAVPTMSRYPRATVPYFSGDPTPQEQFVLELINRARADPSREGIRLAGIVDKDIQQAYGFFAVNLQVFGQQMQGISATPPLVMSGKLLSAARIHSQDMYANDFQGHTGTDGSTPSQRVTAQGYNWRTTGENVFAYAKSEEYAHAGMEVDWGKDATGCIANGMQCALGHRGNNHKAVFREAGIALVNGSGVRVGPMVLTEELATDQSDTPFVTGVVYFDANSNGFYDMGEGVSGVRVDVGGTSFYALSATAGGYAVPVSGPGNYQVSFSAIGVSSYSVAAAVLAVVSARGDNIKVDYRIYSPPPSVSGAATIGVGAISSFRASAVDGYSAYEWMIAEVSTNIVSEGGEGGVAVWQSDVYAGWSIIDAIVVHSGTHALHLVMPEFKRQRITLKRQFRLSAASSLQFWSRLGIASSNQVARVKISSDDGASWSDLWSQIGVGQPGESAYSLRTVNLGGYAGKRVMLRFVYEPYSSGSFFFQRSQGVGWYIDDISLSNVEEMVSVRTVSTSGDRYAWVPPATGDFVVRVRARVASTFTPWGVDKNITVVQQVVGNGGPLDVDGSGLSDASDGVMILRRLNGAGTVITGIVLLPGTTNSLVTGRVDRIGVGFDVDGDGDADANDGVMILRRLNGAGTVTTGIVMPPTIGGMGINGSRINAEVTAAIDGLR